MPNFDLKLNKEETIKIHKKRASYPFNLERNKTYFKIFPMKLEVDFERILSLMFGTIKFKKKCFV